jgi:Tfp pilus assembly protein PilN
VTASLSLYVFKVNQDVHAAETNLDSLKEKSAKTNSDLKRLDQQMDLEQQLQKQKQVIEKLGVYVESDRLLGAISAVMPPQASLLDLTISTKEQYKPVPTLPGTVQQKKLVKLDRQLEVKLHGVAPSPQDVANLMINLGKLTYFEQPALSYARDKSMSGRVMREFEVTFYVNLNSPPEGS